MDLSNANECVEFARGILGDPDWGLSLGFRLLRKLQAVGLWDTSQREYVSGHLEGMPYLFCDPDQWILIRPEVECFEVDLPYPHVQDLFVPVISFRIRGGGEAASLSVRWRPGLFAVLEVGDINAERRAVGINLYRQLDWRLPPSLRDARLWEHSSWPYGGPHLRLLICDLGHGVLMRDIGAVVPLCRICGWDIPPRFEVLSEGP